MTPQVVIRMDLVEFIALLVVGLIGIAVLIFVTWRTYRKLRSQIQQCNEILLKLPLGIIILNTEAKRTFTNNLANLLLERVDPNLVEQAPRNISKESQGTAVLQSLDGALIQLQFQFVGAERTDLLLTLQDMSPQQQAEASQRKFIHTLSHELLTPFTALQLRLATLDTQDEHERQQALQIIRDDVERLTRLTSNLLLLSRLETQQPLQRRITNLSVVVEEAVLQLIPRAQARHIMINIQVAMNLRRPLIDRDAFKQVFLNLIDNGIKYGIDGGKIDINLQQQDSLIQIVISDNGIGISQDDLPHIFTEMFRSDAHRHIAGTGLGLAIVRQIVERHGGQIVCTSEPGEGTTFIISLPTDVTEP